MTDTDRAMLDLAATSFRVPGSMSQQIHERFGLSDTRYWQRVNALLDDPSAREYAPVLCARLARRREAGSRSRSSRLVINL